MLSQTQLILLAAIVLIVVPMALTAVIMSKKLMGLTPGKDTFVPSNECSCAKNGDENVEQGPRVMRGVMRRI